MPLFTIETTYRVPYYRHTTYEAENLAAAIAKARADDDWEKQKEDMDTCGPEYITGAWNGETDHVGDCLFSEPEPNENPKVDWRAIARDLAGALDACSEQIGQMSGMFKDDDGTIAGAIEAADEAGEAYTKAVAGTPLAPSTNWQAIAEAAGWTFDEPANEYRLHDTGEGCDAIDANKSWRELCEAHGLIPNDDAATLRQIQTVLSGNEWDSDTMDQVAEIMRSAGYEIADSNETEPA